MRFGERMRPRLRNLRDQQEPRTQGLSGAMSPATWNDGRRAEPAGRAAKVLHRQSQTHRLAAQVGPSTAVSTTSYANSPVWREKEIFFTKRPWVGPAVCSTLIAGLPELGTLWGRQIAALVGVSRCSIATAERC